LLIKLDPRDYEVALERAQGELDQAKANVLTAQAAVVQAKAGIEQADAQVAQAQAQVTQAGAQYAIAGVNYGRNSSLFTKDARAVAQADVDTTKSSLDANRGALDAAKANAQAAVANADSAKAMEKNREAELVAAQAAVETSQANYDNAKLQLSYCWVLAPVDGRVSRRTVEVGQQLSPGQAIMSITPDDVWVLANFKETQLEKVRVGMRAKIPIDMFKDHPFTGHVDSIQNGSGATYSLLPPDNATGNFTKIVQRVPVKIVFDRDDSKGSIKGFEGVVVPGLSCEPVIDLSSASDRGGHVSKGDFAPPRDNRTQR
jgi:membrane fusion protein (multidrug efflux system)